MLKLTKTGIGLLTKQYRSVLRKCLLINAIFLSLLESENISFAYYGWQDLAIYTYENASPGKMRILTTVNASNYPEIKGPYIDFEDWALDVMNGKFVKDIQSLNYYYTFRVDERDEVIDSASFFQKDFSTLQKVDLHIKNPTHLGAFTKCDEVCQRPSERFASSLSQEQMLKNDASIDAGTSRHCLRQFGDVVADLLRNTVARNMRISEFTNEEVRHA